MSGKSKTNGGILRSKAKSSKPSDGERSGHVSFSSNVQTSTFHPNNLDDDDDDEVDVPPRQSAGGQEYDSDDDDAILASGDGLSMSTRHTADDDDMDDAMHSSKEIELAKRRRGDARHQTDDFDDHDTNNDGSLSLITDQNADPDEYQSNAGGNASCPVEPFNMDAEKEGGLGYFDGDTYIFRKNRVEGEEDAWLDGVEDENEEETSNTKGGLDSMSIWKPKDGVSDGRRKASRYVNDGESQEEIGARIVALLEKEETVMMALRRHGSTLRHLQQREQKLQKKNGLKKRKAKTGSVEQNSHNDGLDEVKNEIKQIRETVEELTELADALLFEGETDAYDLTKADWIHRFKLDGNAKRPAAESLTNGATVKKSRHNYFGGNAAASTAAPSTTDTTTQNSNKLEQAIMWEYKGNEDGSIHGPFTSKQMLEWTSCGYFVGDSAVDIRQIGKTEDKTDADDLMADLMDDDDEKTEANEWMRSDAVDFNAYL